MPVSQAGCKLVWCNKHPTQGPSVQGRHGDGASLPQDLPPRSKIVYGGGGKGSYVAAAEAESAEAEAAGNPHPFQVTSSPA